MATRIYKYSLQHKTFSTAIWKGCVILEAAQRKERHLESNIQLRQLRWCFFKSPQKRKSFWGNQPSPATAPPMDEDDWQRFLFLLALETFSATHCCLNAGPATAGFGVGSGLWFLLFVGLWVYEEKCCRSLELDSYDSHIIYIYIYVCVTGPQAPPASPPSPLSPLPLWWCSGMMVVKCC